MADVDFEDFEGSFGTPEAGMRPARGGRLVNIAGAVTSIGLVVGLGIWGYNIAVRDAHGIPVVRALEGPLRIAPDNPGGEVADHQGLSVNRIAAEGTAAPTADRLVLAPRPVDLAAEDAPGLSGETPVMQAAVAAGPQLQADQAAMLQPASLPMQPEALPAPDPNANVLALAEELAAGASPLADPAAADATAPAGIDAALMEANASVVSGGIGSSLRPPRRPEGDTAASATADVPAAPTTLAAVTEVDPATLTTGTRLVQLGAFDDAAEARAEWDKLAGRFGDLLSGKGRVVQEAQSGGRTFYRLRAEGFADEDDARRFCSALLAENAACIPVAVR